jgi:hypothetical protein
MMNNKNNKYNENEKPVIAASEFTEWLYCPYRYNFEKQDSGRVQEKKKAKKPVSTHKWIKKEI